MSIAWLGCAAPAPRAEPGPPRTLGAELPVFEAPRSTPSPEPPSDPAVEEPSADLSLHDALAAALLRNPELAAWSWEVRVREARAVQAGLLPNPELAVELENLGASGDYRGADQAETTIALGQRLEIGGQRAGRRRVAELDTALARRDFEVQRVGVFADVSGAFVDVLAAQQELALNRELLALGRESLAAIARRVRSGATSAIEQTRLEVLVAAQEIEEQRAESALALARLRLAALWGSSEPGFEVARGDLHEVAAPPPLPGLLGHLAQCPELARWDEEIARREAVVDLEDAARIPDVWASAGVRRLEASDDTVGVLGVSVPFPVFDRNQGERLAASRELAKARQQRRAAALRVEAALRASWTELASTFAEIRALRERALPQAEAAHRGVIEGFGRGLHGYVDVLDARRMLFELRARELDALRRHHRTVAEIERLTGAPLEAGPALARGDHS